MKTITRNIMETYSNIMCLRGNVCETVDAVFAYALCEHFAERRERKSSDYTMCIIKTHMVKNNNLKNKNTNSRRGEISIW